MLIPSFDENHQNETRAYKGIPWPNGRKHLVVFYSHYHKALWLTEFLSLIDAMKILTVEIKSLLKKQIIIKSNGISYSILCLYEIITCSYSFFSIVLSHWPVPLLLVTFYHSDGLLLSCHICKYSIALLPLAPYGFCPNPSSLLSTFSVMCVSVCLLWDWWNQ